MFGDFVKAAAGGFGMLKEIRNIASQIGENPLLCNALNFVVPGAGTALQLYAMADNASESLKGALKQKRTMSSRPVEQHAFSAAEYALDRVAEKASRDAGKSLPELRRILRDASNDPNVRQMLHAQQSTISQHVDSTFLRASEEGRPIEQAYRDTIALFGDDAIRDFDDRFNQASQATVNTLSRLI